LLELPAGALRVETDAGLLEGPGGTVAAARQRGGARGAAGAVWGELIPPGKCPAVRMLRIRILEVARDEVIDRELCPAQANPEALARAIALGVAQSLRSGGGQGLHILDRASTAAPVVPAPPPCPLCPPCPAAPARPETPPVGPPPPPPPEKAAPRVFLSAGPVFSSHPRWGSAGVGFSAEMSWAAWPWLHLGLGAAGFPPRSIEVVDLVASYAEWPVEVFGRVPLRWGPAELLLDAGVFLSFSWMDALITSADDSVHFDRFNPGIGVRAAVRWWAGAGWALEARAGAAFFLSRQRYVYQFFDQEIVLLAMQPVSLEAAFLLTVPIL